MIVEGAHRAGRPHVDLRRAYGIAEVPGVPELDPPTSLIPQCPLHRQQYVSPSSPTPRRRCPAFGGKLSALDCRPRRGPTAVDAVASGRFDPAAYVDAHNQQE
jgi:hypothetical protein